MPHFLVTAVDLPDALDRRIAQRDAHLARIAVLKADNRVVVAGPSLTAEGAMNGSVLILEFPDQATLAAWLQEDAYVAGKVWDRWTITPMKVAIPAL